MANEVELRVRFPVDDRVLTSLHARAFGYSLGGSRPWAQRLQRHSLSWVGAFDRDVLVGFVHACWDGGAHAFVLDTVVDPGHRRCGIGQALVWELREQARAAGCAWLHVDYEPHLAAFYRDACGFLGTEAGLLALHQ